MPSFRDSLELLVTANVSGAVSELESLSKKTDRSLTEAESRIQKFKTTGENLMKGGFAGLAVGGFLTNLASGEEQASASLRASVEQTGGDYDSLKEKLESTSSSMAKFGHTNDDATKALSTLTLATGDANKAMDLMQVVADYAAKKGVSLADAASTIGKVFNGSTKPLREFGITVQTNADGTKNYAGAVQELGQKLQGQAAAGVDSWNGKLKVLAANAENFFAKIGESYGPLILGLSGIMTAAGGAMSGVSTILDKLRVKREADAAAAEAEAAANSEVKASSIGLSGSLLGIAAAAGVAYLAWDQLGKTGAKVSIDVQGFARLSAQEMLKSADQIKTAFGGSGFSEFIDKLKTGGDAGIGALKQLRDAAKAAGEDTSVYDRALADAKTSQDNLNSSVQAGSDALGQASSSGGAYADRLKAIDDAAKSATDSINQAAAASHQFLDASQQAQYAPLDIGDAQARAADAQDKLNAARGKGDPKEIAQANRDLQRAQLDVNRAVNQGAQAEADMKEKQLDAQGVKHTAIDDNNIYKSSLQDLTQFVNEQYLPAVQQEIDQISYLNGLYEQQAQDALTLKKIQETNASPYADTGTVEYHAPGAPTLRAGGGTAGPGWVLRGETGPELTYESGFSSTLNARDTAKAMAAAGGSSQPMVVTQHIYGNPDPQRTAAETARALRRLALLSRPR